MTARMQSLCDRTIRDLASKQKRKQAEVDNYVYTRQRAR